VKPYGSGVPLVVASSAWFRQTQPEVLPRWEATLRAGLLASCPVAALEIMAGARDETDFSDLDRVLSTLPQAPVTATACGSALSAFRALGSRRRLPAADYLIAAAAAERGFGVLHQDRHFDLLATVLGFESVRLDAGSN
jgi:predicted nucleic acid-binding protein